MTFLRSGFCSLRSSTAGMSPCSVIGNYLVPMHMNGIDSWRLDSIPSAVRTWMIGSLAFLGGPQVAQKSSCSLLSPTEDSLPPDSRLTHDCLPELQTPGRPCVLNSLVGSHRVRRTNFGNKGGLGSFLRSHQPCEFLCMFSGTKIIAERKVETVEQWDRE